MRDTSANHSVPFVDKSISSIHHIGPLRQVPLELLEAEHGLQATHNISVQAHELTSAAVPPTLDTTCVSHKFRSVFESIQSNTFISQPSLSYVELSGWQVDHTSGVIFQGSPKSEESFLSMLQETWTIWFPRWFEAWEDNTGGIYLHRFGTFAEGVSPVVYCGSRFSTNYFHWWIDVMSRVLIAMKEPLLKGVPILLPRQIPRFGKEILSAFNIPQDNIYHAKADIERFDTLYFISDAWSGSRTNVAYSSVVFDVLRMVKERFDISTSRSDRLLYITRDDASIRHVLNDRSVHAALMERGFEIIRCSKLSVVDQMRLFGEARLVCGVTGSGLTNVAFCAPNTSVVEIFPATLPNAFIKTLCAGLGHRYHMLAAPSHGVGTTDTALAREDDINIPVDVMCKLIDEVLA